MVLRNLSFSRLRLPLIEEENCFGGLYIRVQSVTKIMTDLTTPFSGGRSRGASQSSQASQISFHHRKSISGLGKLLRCPGLSLDDTVLHGIRQPLLVVLVGLITAGSCLLLCKASVADIVPAAAIRTAHDPDLRTHTCNLIDDYTYIQLFLITSKNTASCSLKNVWTSRCGDA
jgi:hypothetical protein